MADLAFAHRSMPERAGLRVNLPNRLRAWQRLLRRQQRLARLASHIADPGMLDDVGGRPRRRSGFDSFLAMASGRQV